VPKRKVERDSGAYPQSLIVERLEELARIRGFPEGKQIAGLVDARPSWWSERRNLQRDLTLPDISALLAELKPDMQGWLFLDEHHRRALAVGLAELAKEAAASGPREASLKGRSGGRASRGHK
jgi:hypothetical protein